MSRTPKQRLARYRMWLVLNVVLAVAVLLVAAPFWFANPNNPAIVLPAVGALLGWWMSLIPTWISYTRLPKGTR